VRPERAADHSSPSSAAVMEEYSDTFTHPLGHTGPVTGSLLQYFLLFRGFVSSQVAVVQILKHGKGGVVPVRDKGEGIHTFAAFVLDGGEGTNITSRPLYPRRKIR